MAITVFPRNNKIRPSTSISVDTDALAGSATSGDKHLMLLGQADGGQPGVVYEINSYANAKDIFRGGDLLRAIEGAFNPSSTGASANSILALRVGDATQASLVKDGLTFKSLQYNADSNKVQVALKDNSLTKAKDLQVVYQPDKYNYTYTGIGNIFSIKYSGDAAYASAQIEADEEVVAPTTTTTTTTNKTTTTTTTVAPKSAAEDIHTHFATKLILKTGTSAVDAVVAGSFDLGDGLYSTTANLVNDINSIAGFSAEYTAVGNKTGVETKYYDAMKETAIPDGGLTVTSVGGDIVNTLAYDEEIEVTYDPAKGVPTSFGLTALTGGTDGTIPSTWSEFISAFTDEDGYYLVPLTADAAIHAEAVAFAESRSGDGMPTRVVLGGGNKETVKQLTARAAQLRSKRAALIGNSGTRLMNDGTVQQLPGYMLAAMVAGLASGLALGESITFKDLDLLNVDQKFSSEDLDVLDSQGVIPIEYVRNRSGLVFRISDDVNTYVDLDDPVAGQMSAGEASDFLVIDMRDMLDSSFIGQRIDTGAAKDMKVAIIGFLTDEKSRGTILDYDESAISVAIQGNQATISAVVAPSLVIKKIKVGIVYNNETLEA